MTITNVFLAEKGDQIINRDLSHFKRKGFFSVGSITLTSRSIFSTSEETCSRGVYSCALFSAECFEIFSYVAEAEVVAQGKYCRTFPRS